MLTYPDRHRFEQIRARWETAQPSEERQAEMAGWRDKPTSQQPTNVESRGNGASKFRRKLSHGFSSLISNPLSQRKVTPACDHLEAPRLAATDSQATNVITATIVCDAPNSPAHKSTSLVDLVKTASGKAEQRGADGTLQSVDAHTAPKPLPRSRTLSFIPLPVKTGPNSFAVEVDGVVKVNLLTAMSQPEPESVPTKIPSPSPEMYEHRCYSPRRYLHHHASYNASQQRKHNATTHAFNSVSGSHPANSSQPLQSRTTQNVVKGPNKPHPAGFMAPRKPGPRGSVAPQRFEKPVLQENIPMNKRVASKQSQIQERALKRESLAVAGTLYHRRSFGESNPVMQGKGTSFATPPTSSKRTTSHSSQNTPVTVKRIQRHDQVASQTTNHLTTKPGSVSKASLLDTPKAPISRGVEPSKQRLLQPCTQADFSKKTPSTLDSLSGVSRLTRAFGIVNPDVSKLPRSQTFHNFGAQSEDAPPVPLLPAQYRQSSLSDITRQYRMMQNTPTTSCHGRMILDANVCRFIVEESAEEMEYHDSTSVPVEAGSVSSQPGTPTSSITSSTVFPLTSNTPRLSKPGTTTTSSETMPSSEKVPGKSCGDIREQTILNVSDTAALQVEDYMPTLYWAGRFQSRYDQWRTDATNSELGIQSDYQMSNPLSEYKLDQENLAACYIFTQLRDLYCSDQAADSLWEFEYRYRKDNRLLSNSYDRGMKPCSRREGKTAPAEAETGALGRALKKLTPRKSSLANLVKGKGWNKADESKQHNRLEGD